MEPITLQDGTSLDPKIVKVMRAIRQVESGGDFNAVGDNGESHGAYQWNKNNYKNAAKQYLGDENAPMTPENQNKVAYSQIKAYKDQGLQPEEIAARWNGAHKDEAGSYTYNNPEYGKKFRDALQANQQENSGFVTNVDLPEAQPTQQSGVLGTNPTDSTFGKITNNSLTRGLINLVPGASTLSKSIGTLGGLAAEKVKGAFGGQDNSKNYDLSAPSPVDTAIAGAEFVGTGATVQGLGGLLGSIQGGSALATEPVQSVLSQAAGKESISALTASEKVNALSHALSQAEPGVRPIFQKALQELAPKVLKEAGIGSLSELHPAISKALGLLAKLGLFAGGAVAGSAVGQAVDSFKNNLIPK